MTRPLTARERSLLGIVAVSALIAMGYAYVVQPVRRGIRALDEKTDHLQTKILKERRMITRAQAVEEEYAALMTRFRQVESNEQVMSATLSEIEGVAHTLQLKISELKPNAVEEKKGFNRFSVSLMLTSSFPEALQFIHTLQGPPHLFSVEKFRFEKQFGRDSGGIRSSLVLTRTRIPAKD